jgi:hypothetical protein
VLVTQIPRELEGRGIELPQLAHAFTISLDAAAPWGGGRIEGRVEARDGKHGPRPVTIAVRCIASWLDAAPQLVGQKPFFRLDTLWDLRTRGIPIWIDEDVWTERWEIGDLAGANWRHFAIDLPPELPRAFEGTFVSFRWRVEAARQRRFGHERASLPLVLVEPRTRPVVRVETSPLGHWRLLEWKADDERDGAAGPCSITFEERRPGDAPLDGETREQELRRRA